jgi:hypothetical protein
MQQTLRSHSLAPLLQGLSLLALCYCQTWSALLAQARILHQGIFEQNYI